MHFSSFAPLPGKWLIEIKRDRKGIQKFCEFLANFFFKFIYFVLFILVMLGDLKRFLSFKFFISVDEFSSNNRSSSSVLNWFVWLLIFMHAFLNIPSTCKLKMQLNFPNHSQAFIRCAGNHTVASINDSGLKFIPIFIHM